MICGGDECCKLSGGFGGISMMKNVVCALVLLVGWSVFAQNLQLHYDFGEDRHFVTTTLEMFKPDDFGAIFWFVDFDYNDATGDQSAAMAYWEIARYFNLPFFKNSAVLSKLSATAQYNDGLNTFGGFGSVWLAGLSYPVDLKIITINTDILLRKAEAQDLGYQLTLVWFKPFLDGKIVFTGFLDIWNQTNFDADTDGTDAQVVLLTEPQLWYNVSDQLAIGGEIEISRNFVFAAGSDLKLMPTLGLKWVF
jgi:hypothetical protein